MNNPAGKAEHTAIFHKLCPALCSALFVMAPMSASLAASAQIPRGEIIFKKGTNGDGCMLNGEHHPDGEKVKVQQDNPDGTKTTITVVCTTEGWKKA
jgi:hypothetical protein